MSVDSTLEDERAINVCLEAERMTVEERSIPIVKAIEIAGYTHIQIVCCKAVLKPLATLPPAAQQLSLDALSPRLRCSSCGKPASPSRVAFWKHGMRQLR